MKLYHGSNQLVTQIDLLKSKDFKDFGRGFYMTRDYGRTVAMAQRTSSLKYPGSEYIQYCFCTQKGIEQLILDI